MAQHPIDPIQGGTGVSNNNASTLTISGSYPLTFTLSGSTSVTFPTSGTLLTSSSAATSITGTANQITASASTGAVTLSLPSTLIAPGSLQVTTNLIDSTTAAVTAAGTTQGTATALTTDINNVTTVGSGSGVILPTPSVAGYTITVINNGSNPLLLYPASGGAIDGGTTNAAISIPVGQTWSGTATGTTAWETVITPVNQGTGISVTYGTGELTIANTGVTTIVGTSNQITASAATGSVTLSLPASVTTTNLTLSGLTANSFLYSGTSGLLTTTSAPTNGQILIGSTGVAPVASTITTSGSGISVTNGAGTITLANTGVTSITGTTNEVIASASTGSITLSLPQAIATTSTPTFAQLTISNSPVNPTDTVNLSYLQGVIAGLEWKDAVAAATTANLAATYSNGSSGVGATLTNNGAQAAFSVDGYSANLNDRILVKNQTTQTQNGIYYVSTVGSGSTNWVLTRAIDANTSSALNNATVLVTNGTTNANTSWTQTTASPTIGTNNIVFVQFGAGATYTAGTGLTLTGNTFSITNVGTANTYGSASQVPVFTTNAQGQVSAVTNTNIAIAGSAITSGTVSAQYGGTGVNGSTAGNGTLLIGNGSGYTLTTLTGTSNEITVTNGSGSITLSVPNTFVAPGYVQVTTELYLSTTTGITAAGTTLGTATALTTQYNVVTTVTSGTGVSLPTPSFGGAIVTIVNRGANSLNVYPPNSSSTIDGAATGAAVVLPVNATAEYSSSSTTAWYTVNPPDVAGTGISVTYGNGSVTVANTGVTSITGTASQITASASTGGVTLSLPASVSTTNLTLTGLTANSFLYSGTGGLLTTTSAPTNGQLLIGSTGAAPVAASLTAGTGITITPGAGTITIASTSSGFSTSATTSNLTYYVVGATTTGSTTPWISNTNAISFNASTGQLSAVSFLTTSDAAKKTNVRTIDQAVETVKQLRGVKFDWKDTGAASVGVIAQEVETILPELVDSSTEVKAVNYSGLVGVLIQAVKELSDKVNMLEAQLEKVTRGI